MSYEILVGLDIINEEVYQKYRNAMIPILLFYGGYFVYDFKVAEVLKSESKNKINRVFTINFPDSKKMDAFFLDTKYKLIKEKYFSNSVASTTIISSYEKNIQ